MQARSGVGGGYRHGVGALLLSQFQGQEGVGLGAPVADDDYGVVGPQGRRVAAELEGMPPLHLDVRAGESAEPVFGHQHRVPRGADAHDVDVPLGGQDFGNLLGPGRMPVQHPGNGLGLADDGVVHEVRVRLPDFRLLAHGVPFFTVE